MIKQNNILGILLSLAGYTTWVASDTFVKLAGAYMPIIEIMSIAFFTSACFTVLVASMKGGLSQLLTRRFAFHGMRSIFSMGGEYGSLVGIIYLSLTDFYTIVFSSPLILTALASVFLKEKVDYKMWLAIILGFTGVLIAVRFSNLSGVHLSLYGVLATCLASLSLALTMLTVRSATHENNYALTFWPQITNGIVSVLVMLWFGHITSTPIGIIFALCSGILGGLGVLLTNASLQVAPVAVVSPYHYTQIIGGAIVGYLIWGHIPTWSTILGAMIITVSGLYILHTEATKQLPATQYLIE